MGVCYWSSLNFSINHGRFALDYPTVEIMKGISKKSLKRMAYSHR
jgi:hypothetical protein